MNTSEIRKRWLDFFEKKGHTIVPSHSLISPDPSTLFTIAGMVPFIPYMTAQQSPPHEWNKRATSVQKCVRTADIDEVGKTTRHGTFFQMNGNFSFGDYFKAEAIEFAWEFLTGSQSDGCLGFSKDKLWATVWEDDEEAYNKWLEVGLSASKLQKRDKVENFWSTGGPGPAGPCSEIFFDRGPEYGEEGGPIHDDEVGSERYLEIWNLVFMQWEITNVKSKYDFDIVGDLKQKNIDTGMGLERVAFLLQNKQNVYEIDEIFPVIEKVQELTGKVYGKNHNDDVHMRILADHIRSGLMIISDGVVPSNEGRGYVLRRLLRRSLRSIKLLGYEDNSFEELFTTSYKQMRKSYPELTDNWEKILNVAVDEEKLFSRTLKSGNAFLQTAINEALTSKTAINGDAAFKLHDTHGFPIELTLEIADAAGVAVDRKGFEQAMLEQKTRARQDALEKRGSAVDTNVYSQLAKDIATKLKVDESKVIGNNAGISEFLGYDTFENTVQIVGIISENGPVPTISANQNSENTADSDKIGLSGTNVEVILDRTPFYAQSGGQLGDQGVILMDSGAVLEVDDVQKPIPLLSVHKARLVSGAISLNDKGLAKVDVNRRLQITKAHTSTHIIHKALHEFVGDGATQAGSENSPGRVRFDFKATSPISNDIMQEIETRANQKVRENTEIQSNYMNINKAKEIGAMALFGEKYADDVRVVSLGLSDSDTPGTEDSNNAWSIELCGGTHVQRTGDIGQITLLGEGSIGSGTRRIEALVGDTSNSYRQKEHALVSNISTLLGTKNPDEITSRISELMQKLKIAEKREAEQSEQALLRDVEKVISLTRPTKAVFSTLNNLPSSDVSVVNYNAGKLLTADSLRVAVLATRERLGESSAFVIAYGAIVNDKPAVIVATNEMARKIGVSAGQIVKDMSALLGGGGGGKPDLAQGGGQDTSKLDEVLQKL